MLTKTHRILEPFARQPWKKLTFKEVKTLTRNNSDNYVHTALKRFVRERVLEEQKVGNNILYSAQHTIESLNAIGFVAEHRAAAAKQLPHRNLEKLAAKLKTAFYSLIVTGSYARSTHRETSDLDIVIICDNNQKQGSILAQVKLESELQVPEVHPYVFTQDQFYHMLTAEEENYGKEIARNNLIITGGRAYYKIVMEAVHHGFNG